MIFTKKTGLKGELNIPGDKSISHRSVMLGSLSNGTMRVSNILKGEDCISTMNAFRKMGVDITEEDDDVIIKGVGLHGLKAPVSSTTAFTSAGIATVIGTLDMGNSGTTTRLMSGILAAQDFTVTLDGDASLRKRPMKRIITPLSMMGADIKSANEKGTLPLIISGSSLKGIHYDSPVASAQVKSSILLAGLYADGETSVTEPYVSRNHTELMFNYLGIKCKTCGTTATVSPCDGFDARDIVVPGDISSAAYFLVAGLITPDSEITLKNVGINETRDGIIRVIKMMGGDIKIENEINDGGEISADITVKTSTLHGCVIEGSIIPTLIDEIPIICIMAAFAKGQTIIKDAAELRVKESDRIELMVKFLSAMGCDIVGTKDGMIINGGNPLKGAVIDSNLDHRIAMSFAIAGINASGETEILGSEVVNISYPGFYKDLESLWN